MLMTLTFTESARLADFFAQFYGVCYQAAQYAMEKGIKYLQELAQAEAPWSQPGTYTRISANDREYTWVSSGLLRDTIFGYVPGYTPMPPGEARQGGVISAKSNPADPFMQHLAGQGGASRVSKSKRQVGGKTVNQYQVEGLHQQQTTNKYIQSSQEGIGSVSAILTMRTDYAPAVQQWESSGSPEYKESPGTIAPHGAPVIVKVLEEHQTAFWDIVKREFAIKMQELWHK